MIKHILKNGQQVDSIEGIVLKMDEFPKVYELMDRINERLAKEEIKGGDK